MKCVSAAEFKKKSGTYQDMALSEPVTITKHDRPTLVLMSYAEYHRLTSETVKVPAPELRLLSPAGDLPRVAVEALKLAKKHTAA